MRNIATFVIGIIIFTLASSRVQAIFVAGNSADIHYTVSQTEASLKSRELLIKKMTIKRVLERYGSPLQNSVDSFISTCFKYNLDCYLLPSIAGIESTFGKFIYPNSYNPFGWGGGLIMFTSFNEGIETVGKGLKENYIAKGAVTIEQIGKIYCTGDTWSGKVRFFMNQFKKEEENQLLLLSNTIQL